MLAARQDIRVVERAGHDTHVATMPGFPEEAAPTGASSVQVPSFGGVNGVPAVPAVSWMKLNGFTMTSRLVIFFSSMITSLSTKRGRLRYARGLSNEIYILNG